jgi:hypothetical protein
VGKDVPERCCTPCAARVGIDVGVCITYEYMEIADGDHITVAYTSLPKIFEFFDKHKRAPKAKQ